MDCQKGRFTNNLSMTAVKLIVSSSIPVLSLVSKEYHFVYFPLKSPVIFEIPELRLLRLFIRMSRESQKD